MKDDITDFKKIINSDLEHIYVTDELKDITINKCQKEGHKNNHKFFAAIAASAAVIALSLTTYKYLSQGSNNFLKDQKQIVSNKSNMESPKNNKGSENKFHNPTSSTEKGNTKENIAYSSVNGSSTGSNYSTSNKSNDSSAENKLVNTSIPSDMSNSANNSPAPTIETPSSVTQDTQSPNQIAQNTPTSISDAILPSRKEEKSLNSSNNLSSGDTVSTLTAPASTLDAEKYWGEKISLPTYIPEGFELTDIFIPSDNTKEKYLKFTYSCKDSYFRILQNKSTTYSITGKTINVNGITACLTQTKDENNSASIVTQIDWIKNNIQYSISGNISDSELINIIKSMQ